MAQIEPRGVVKGDVIIDRQTWGRTTVNHIRATDKGVTFWCSNGQIPFYKTGDMVEIPEVRYGA